jgi:glycogen synthase
VAKVFCYRRKPAYSKGVLTHFQFVGELVETKEVVTGYGRFDSETAMRAWAARHDIPCVKDPDHD